MVISESRTQRGWCTLLLEAQPALFWTCFSSKVPKSVTFFFAYNWSIFALKLIWMQTTWYENKWYLLWKHLIHALWFIKNVYKERFFGLVKFLENLMNSTSPIWNDKEQIPRNTKLVQYTLDLKNVASKTVKMWKMTISYFHIYYMVWKVYINLSALSWSVRSQKYSNERTEI